MSRGQIEGDRRSLIKALNDEAGRKSGTAAILYQLAIADRLGLGLTDLVCGEILSRTGAITAGELAELSGLTTGAITGVVDRLEKTGFVRRVSDPNDRRRVMLEPIAERFERLSGNPYAALEARFGELYADYDDAELGLLLEFMRKSITIFDQEAVRLRKPAPPSGQAPGSKTYPEAELDARMEAQGKAHAGRHAQADREPLVSIRKGGHKESRVFSAPRGNLTAARLEWLSGPVRLNLRGQRGISELYRAEFKHDIPIVRDQDGKVSVQYRHRTLFGRGGGDAEVKLNTAARWDMHFECGASHVDADLRELTLGDFSLKGNTGKIALLLPPPTGTIRLRIESGVSGIHIERPKKIPVRLELEGDWSVLHFDRQKMNVSNEIRESPEYKKATDRYLIQVIGGGSRLTVEESKG